MLTVHPPQRTPGKSALRPAFQQTLHRHPDTRLRQQRPPMSKIAAVSQQNSLPGSSASLTESGRISFISTQPVPRGKRSCAALQQSVLYAVTMLARIIRLRLSLRKTVRRGVNWHTYRCKHHLRIQKWQQLTCRQPATDAPSLVLLCNSAMHTATHSHDRIAGVQDNSC